MANKEKDDANEEEVVMESTQSQLIETGFSAQDSSEEVLDTPKKVTRSKKNSSVDIEHIKILVAFLMAALFAFLAYNNLDTIAKKYLQTQQQELKVKTKEIAMVVDQRISVFQHKFKNKQHETIINNDKIKSDDLFLNSTISYLSLPLNHTEIVDNPALGYAFLDLLDQLYSKNTLISPIEIIKPNSEFSTTIIVKKAIENSSDSADKIEEAENVTGFYICTLPKNFSQQLLQNIELNNDAITLYQGFGTLVKLAGIGTMGTGKINQSYPINSKLWNLNYATEAKTIDSNPSSYILFLIYALFSFILFIYGLFLAINKIKELKALSKKEQTSSSILDNKQSISKLGMQNSTALTDITKAPKKTSSTEQKMASVDKIDLAIFSDYGIRGIFGTQINAPIFTFLAHGIAQQMESRELSKLTIGYDGRTSSEELYQALLDGLASYEIKIIDLGLVTLPVAYFCAQAQTQGNALMVTAGSSPAEYNGLKILLNNEIVSQSQLHALVDTIPEEGKQLAQVEKQNLNHTYINSLSESFNLQKQLSVVVDFANGVSSQIIFDLLKILGCQIIPLFEKLDGDFPNHPPQPSKTENLQALSEKVKSESADIGLAFNGDGSALGIVASNGDIIWADRVLMLLAKELLQQNPGAKVMYDVKSTSSLHEWIISHKGEPESTPSGYTNIIPRMQANNAALAGELSGHIFFAEHLNGLDDAFYCAAKILQSVSSHPGKSAELFKEIPEKISTPEILIAVQPGQQEEIMKKILAQKSEFMPAGLITLDGLRVEYEDGWGVVRQSKTTSSLSLRFEADNPQALQRIAEKFKEVVLSVVFVKFPY